MNENIKHHFCPLENKVSKKASFLSITPKFELKIEMNENIKHHFCPLENKVSKKASFLSITPIFYTLLGSCLQADIEPHQWLTSTLEKIPALQTPINWEELLP